MATSLRASKKAATRLAISDTATALFLEHGYEEVTLAQVAAAAGVTVKTILNHFSTKDELYFDRAQQVLDALRTAIVERAAGVTVLGALREVLTERRVPFDSRGWAGLHEPGGFEGYRRFVLVEHRAPALQARRLVIGREWAAALEPTLAAELELDRGDLRLRALAAMLITALEVRGRALSEGVLARDPPAEVEARTRAVVEDAFDRLERAFGELDRPR